MSKVLELFGSRRFWLITAGAVATVLASWSQGNLSVDSALDTFQVWVLAVVSVGTVDKIGTK